MKRVREGYKMTELGEIPVEWEVQSVGNIAELITKGTTPSTIGFDFVEDGINYIRAENINQYGKFEGQFLKISKECNDKLLRSNIRANDILVSIVGYYLGKTAIVSAKEAPANTNQNLAIVRISNTNYEPSYIKRLFESNYLKMYINQSVTVGAQPSLSLKQIGDFVAPIPPIKEQKKIADIFMTVDEQIENTDKLIGKTKELKKGLMQRLLTKGIGHSRFKDTEVGRIPEEWDVRKLGEVFKVSSGNFLSQKSIVEGKHPVYGGNGVTGYHKEYLFEDSKIVIGRVGAKCGCVCISEPKSWITDNALFISNKFIEFEDKFMFYLLSYLNLNQYANQNAQPVISGQKIYELKVAFPSKGEQKKITNIISTVDEQINQYETKKEKLQGLKNGLMQKLLTGKLRVNG